MADKLRPTAWNAVDARKPCKVENKPLAATEGVESDRSLQGSVPPEAPPGQVFGSVTSGGQDSQHRRDAPTGTRRKRRAGRAWPLLAHRETQESPPRAPPPLV